MISVVIPLYDKEGGVRRALESVQAQTYQDFEIVVVDDGSTDGSAEVVRSIADNRIRLISQSNAGVSAARNRGIQEAKGEYIALLDADDEWRPDYLHAQMELALKYPQCDVFATNYEFRDSNGTVKPTIINRLPFDSEDGVLENYFEVASCSHPPLWTSAVMVRKTSIETVGGFPVGVKSGEDLLTWARLACKYKIAWSKRVEAVFCQAWNEKENRSATRLGGEIIVLEELQHLQQSVPTLAISRQLNQYILRFYQISAVLMIEAGQGHKAIKLSIEAIRRGGRLSIFSATLLLGLLPTGLSRWLFLKLRR